MESNADRSRFALYPLRFGLAMVFIYTGYTKFSDLGAVTDMFGDWGIPLAAIAAPLVAFAELAGGIGIFLGVLPRFSSAVLSIVMLTAMFAVNIPGTFFGGWAFDLALLAGLVTVLINGPGEPTVASISGNEALDLETPIIRRLSQRS